MLKRFLSFQSIKKELWLHYVCYIVYFILKNSIVNLSVGNILSIYFHVPLFSFMICGVCFRYAIYCILEMSLWREKFFV